MIRLLVATNNPGKVREYEALLRGLPLTLTYLAQEGIHIEVEETGSTFAENARLKATAYARASGLLTLADDSGLEVDALGGEPGTRSARYAGQEASDEDRYRLLLSKLEGVPWERRTARFRCVAAVFPGGIFNKILPGHEQVSGLQGSHLSDTRYASHRIARITGIEHHEDIASLFHFFQKGLRHGL